MRETEKEAMVSETIQDKKEDSPILPHSLEDRPENYINMTEVLMKMVEVVACLEGHITHANMRQDNDPSVSLDCIIEGRAYDFSFSKSNF